MGCVATHGRPRRRLERAAAGIAPGSRVGPDEDNDAGPNDNAARTDADADPRPVAAIIDVQPPAAATQHRAGAMLTAQSGGATYALQTQTQEAMAPPA
jgi:hypothetical protein